MNLENIEVKINKPYPELKDVKEDKHTVGVLKNLANGRVGELGAVLTYTYQNVVAYPCLKEVAEIIEEISIVEMMHLHLLMHAIKEFGGLPIFENAHSVPFNAGSLNYTPKLKEMLDNNIMNEKMAIENYSQAIDSVSNISLRALFLRIIEDEKRHVEVFTKLRDSISFLSV